MSYSSTIHLPSVKSPRRRIELAYMEESVKLSQARLEDRCVLMPAIDLKAYTCRAVLDWVKIEIELSRATPISHIRRKLSVATGGSIWVKAIDDGAGGSSTRFLMTLQEPNLRDILEHVAILKRVFGLVGPPAVAGLELSIDFYPLAPSDERLMA